MQEWLRRLAHLLFPANDQEGESREDEGGGSPAEAGQSEGAGAPGEGQAESGQQAGEGEGESEIERLRRENEELQARHERGVREEAERLLTDTMPELYGAGAGAEPPPGYAGQGAGGESGEGEEPSEEERYERLESKLQQMELDQQSRALVQHLETRRRDAYPHMNLQEVLQIIATRPNVNIERLCELSHRRTIDRYEDYHNRKLQDPEYRRQLLGKLQGQPGGPPAGASENGGAAGPRPTRLPGTGPTSTGATPITRKNASRVFAERLRAKGFGQR